MPYKHGMSNTREFQTWNSMKTRCNCPNSKVYKNHGGRGIKVCDRWLESFENFYEDMGDKPKGMTLERINNDGDYSPENCRWATHKEQHNNKRTCRYITIDGVTRTITQWAEATGIKKVTLTKRIARGWPPEKAVSTDPRHYGC